MCFNTYFQETSRFSDLSKLSTKSIFTLTWTHFPKNLPLRQSLFSSWLHRLSSVLEIVPSLLATFSCGGLRILSLEQPGQEKNKEIFMENQLGEICMTRISWQTCLQSFVSSGTSAFDSRILYPKGVICVRGDDTIMYAVHSTVLIKCRVCSYFH